MTASGGFLARVYAQASPRPPLGRLAQGVVAALILVIGAVDLVTQLEGGPGREAPIPAAAAFWEATSVASGLAALWLAWPLLRAIHAARLRPARRLATLVALGLGAAALHIAAFKLLRAGGAALLGPAFVCPLAGKLAYEFAKDFAVIGALLAGLFVAPAGLRRAIFEPPVAPRGPILVQSTPELLDLPDGRNRRRLRSSEIIAVNAVGNYAEFRLVGGARPLLRATLARLEAQLAALGFLRVHRSWIVNPAHVRLIRAQPSGGFQLTLADGETIPASRRYSEAMAGVIGAGEALGGRRDHPPSPLADVSPT